MTTTPAPQLRLALAVLAPLITVLLTVLLARPAAARDLPVPGDWQLPLPGTPTVLKPFDPPAEKWGAGHRGVDLATTVGADVLAAGSGVVAYAGRVAGRGVVSLGHGNVRTTYQPVRASVRAGETVHAGQVIGTITADAHCGARSCLHWGLVRGDQYLDPMTLLRAHAPRLLPVWGIPSGAAATAEPTGTPTWHRPHQLAHRQARSPTPQPTPVRSAESNPLPVAPAGALAGIAGAAAVGVLGSRRSRGFRGTRRSP